MCASQFTLWIVKNEIAIYAIVVVRQTWMWVYIKYVNKNLVSESGHRLNTFYNIQEHARHGKELMRVLYVALKFICSNIDSIPATVELDGLGRQIW